MNETAKLALFVALVMLVLSGAIFTSSYFKKTDTDPVTGARISYDPVTGVISSYDPVTGALISSKTKDPAAEYQKIINDTTASLTNTFSSSFTDQNFVRRTKLEPGSILVADAVGNVSSSQIGIPFITSCCESIKALIDDVAPKSDGIYSSLKTDATYVKKPETSVNKRPVTYNAYTGALEMVSLPANSILSTDTNGNIVTTPYSLPSCCDKIKDTTVDYKTTFSSNYIDTNYQRRAVADSQHLVMMDANGNLVDSGLTPAAIQAQAAKAASDSLLKSDIVDTSLSATKLYSSLKIDDTFQKKAIAPANAIVVVDAKGDLVDSGFTPQFLQNCCAQAATGSVNGLMKADIVDTSTATDKLYSSSKIDTTYQKKTTAPANAILMPDANGNLVDSGLTPLAITTCCTTAMKAANESLKIVDIIDTSTATDKLYSSSKIDMTYQKKTTAPANSLLMPDANGNLVDSGLTPTAIQACCTKAVSAATNSLLKTDIVDTSTSTDKLYSSSKIDATFTKKTTAPANVLLMPDANGNLVDSGITPAFISACCRETADAKIGVANALSKSDIVDTSTSATKLYSSSKIDATYQKKTTAPANSLLMPDANGNLVDSGLTPTAIQACCTQAVGAATNSLLKTDIVDTSISTDKLYSSSKIDATYSKKTTAPANSLLMPDADGNLVDSGLTPAGIQACCTKAVNVATNSLLKTDIIDTSTSTDKLYSSSKIDATYQKKTTAPANVLLMPDASGNLVDSGITPAFISACCQQTTSATTAVANALLKSDIVDTSTSATKLYSSSKIDATYSKKTTAPANAILVPDANGNLVDSGLTPTAIQACCTQAVNAATNSLLKTDIVDTSTSTTKLYSSSKIDATYIKKTTAPANALLMPDASGNLVDSGLTPAGIQACCTQAASAATNSLLKTDIVDTSTSATKLYSSSKIDATFQKKSTAAANNLLLLDTSGNLVSSGITPKQIETCCATANQALGSTNLYYLQFTSVLPFKAVANTWTLASYTSKRYDTTSGWYANGKFQPQKAGAWSIRATAWAPRTLGGNRIHFCLAQNAAMNPLWADVNSWNANLQTNVTTFTAKVDALFVLNGTTDYVSAYFMTNSLPQDFDASENCNMFQAFYLGAMYEISPY